MAVVRSASVPQALSLAAEYVVPLPRQAVGKRGDVRRQACVHAVTQRSFFGVKLSSAEVHSQRTRNDRPGPLPVEAAVKINSGRTIVFTARFEALPESRESVMAECAKFVDTTLASKDSVKGVISFDCSEDSHEPGVFHFWQRYSDTVSMSDHLASPEYTAFTDKVSPLLAGPVALACYEYKNGQLGPVAVPIGPKGEGGLDDATGASKMAAGAGLQQHQKLDIGMIHGNSEKKAWGMDEMLKKLTDQTDGAAKAITGGGSLLSSIGELFVGKKK